MILTYDGTPTCLMTVIFTVYENKWEPQNITAKESVQPSLTGDVEFIPSDPEKARRVIAGIAKYGSELLHTLNMVFASAFADKDMTILAFLRLLFKRGAAALTMHADKACADFFNTALRVGGEVQHYKGFLRFGETESGVWYSEIEPENDLLLVDDFRNHFADRYNSMPFLIRDKRHKRMMVYDGAAYLTDDMGDFDVRYTPRELSAQAVWKEFVAAVAIKERKSSKRQMTFVPLRHRKTMTEFLEKTDVVLYGDGEDEKLPKVRD